MTIASCAIDARTSIGVVVGAMTIFQTSLAPNNARNASIARRAVNARTARIATHGKCRRVDVRVAIRYAARATIAKTVAARAGIVNRARKRTRRTLQVVARVIAARIAAIAVRTMP